MKHFNKLITAALTLIIAIALLCSACASGNTVALAETPEPTPTATAAPTATPTETPLPTPTVRPELTTEEEKELLGINYKFNPILLNGIGVIIFRLSENQTSDEYSKTYNIREMWTTADWDKSGHFILSSFQSGEIVLSTVETYETICLDDLPKMELDFAGEQYKGSIVLWAGSLRDLKNGYREMGFEYRSSYLLDGIQYKLLSEIENVSVNPDELAEVYLLEVPKERRTPAWEYVPGYPSPTPET